MSREPHWILDDDWAIGTDSYSWILYRRCRNKHGEPTGWRARSWYHSAEQLFESLLRKITREGKCSDDVIEHLEQCYERAQALSGRFSEMLQAEIWVGLQRPQKRAVA